MSEINNENGYIKEKDPEGKAKKRRPFWFYVAWVLAGLFLIAIVLVAITLKQFSSLGYFEKIPIINKANPSATIGQPQGLEPADNNGNTDNTQGDNVDLNQTGSKIPIYAQTPIDSNVVNILVIGLDSRIPGGNGRDDLNMIVSIDRKNKTIKLASILRDTLVPIEGHDWNRLNSTYIFGGPGLTINTINSIYKMDIQRYVKLDFFAIQDIIDAVGGVDVKLTDNEVTYLRAGGYTVSKGAGVKHLNGTVGLAYSRIRKIDGDFQRTQRQRNVLTAALGKVRGMGVVNAINLMTKLLPKVKTNISTNDAITLATEVIGISGSDMKQIALPVLGSFTNKKYKGMAILSVDFDKNTTALKSFLYGTGK